MGPAGAGKSTTARTLYQFLQWRSSTKEPEWLIHWTSSTGASAFAYPGGQTVHSFLGLGIAANISSCSDLENEVNRQGQQEFWQAGKTRVAFIDEFQRLSANLLGYVMEYAKVQRIDLYLILAGDIGQASSSNEESIAQFVEGCKGPCLELKERHRFDSTLASYLDLAANQLLTGEHIAVINKDFGNCVDEKRTVHLVRVTRAARTVIWETIANESEDDVIRLDGVGNDWPQAN